MYSNKTWSELFNDFKFETRRLDKQNREQALKLIRREVNKRLRLEEKNGSHVRGLARKRIAEERKFLRERNKRR